MTIMTPEGQRIPPKLPITAMRTFGIHAPIETHRRRASCEEYGCDGITYGFQVIVDESTDLGQRQAHYIRHDGSRRCTEVRRPDGLTEFRYDVGQRCFSEHTLPLDREPLFVVRDGDWRGNPTGWSRRHSSADSWADDFNTALEALQ